MPERNWPSWSTELRTSAVEIERVVETSASTKYDQYLSRAGSSCCHSGSPAFRRQVDEAEPFLDSGLIPAPTTFWRRMRVIPLNIRIPSRRDAGQLHQAVARVSLQKLGLPLRTHSGRRGQHPQWWWHRGPLELRAGKVLNHTAKELKDQLSRLSEKVASTNGSRGGSCRSLSSFLGSNSCRWRRSGCSWRRRWCGG